MLSKAKLKQYQQLGSKKFRQKYGLFVVEGLKSVNELVKSDWTVECILCTSSFSDQHNQNLNFQCDSISREEFYKISGQKNPQEILAIAEIARPTLAESNWEIALDTINDPGNLGTIIRIADWYGITKIYCSKNSVDMFNSKTIQASMGSFLRVELVEGNLDELLRNKEVYATLLEGANIRTMDKPQAGVILIGNEANGISKEVLDALNPVAVSIPRIGKAESLNAAIATAICCERLIG
ncbi:MAG: RNA methyltransferase [Bacteroidia bacterium]|nr:RNA methyltransferase [Bacteroidia bacterium]